ncbi:sterol desaturase family protein [Psychrobacter sp. ANT_WB68]|uniref:sterol desaturase family protein n=1 Tax=Psychrobacter sp. ANT_WB68 TaxID=2597355 RepID=UPI0011F11732|nr:sterol desaturase family protein [Psychrobacter sp. ANT_WB68]KAA0915316.1 hypothetical protein FQ084_01800 [Psychrobacter sp. ANT_WB68]
MDVFSYWQGFYNDPWFWQFPMATLAISTAAFLAVAIPWTIVAWRDPVSLRKYKIQQKPFELKQFLLPSIGRIIINNIILAALLVLAWPLLKLTGVHNGEMPVWYIIIAQLIFFVLLDDFLYYCMHRYMHENKWLLRNIHSVHHRIRNTCGINGNYMHWVEYSLTASLTVSGSNHSRDAYLCGLDVGDFTSNRRSRWAYWLRYSLESRAFIACVRRPCLS